MAHACKCVFGLCCQADGNISVGRVVQMVFDTPAVINMRLFAQMLHSMRSLVGHPPLNSLKSDWLAGQTGINV